MKQHRNIKINLTNAEFNCKVLGNGPIHVIAFHGFGQDGNAFLPFTIQNPQYTIYSFDLPFHGETKIRNPSLALMNQEVNELIQNLLKKITIERFSLMAFSIGSKLLFPILEEFHSRIENVWLLAPDGIKLSFWYRAATRTRFLRHLFYQVLKKDRILNRLGEILSSIKIVDKTTISFAVKSINTPTKRERVYDTWAYLRVLKINSITLSNKLNATNILVHFIMGERDKIIPLSKIKSLHQKLNNSIIVTLPCGHHRIIEYFSAWNSKSIN